MRVDGPGHIIARKAFLSGIIRGFKSENFERCICINGSFNCALAIPESEVRLTRERPDERVSKGEAYDFVRMSLGCQWV